MGSTYSRPILTKVDSHAGATAPDSGALAFGAITGTNAATANTVVTTTTTRGILEVINASDADVVLTLDNVSLNLIVRAGQAKIYDLQQANVRINGGHALGVYRRSGAPTTNEVIIQLI